MARFYGPVGFGITKETAPSVYEEQIIERNYSGDILQFSRRFDNAQQVNDNLAVTNKISIIGNPFAYENFANIRYVKWMGARWKVSSIEVDYPRLVMSIGGVYNGPEPASTP